MKILLVNTRHFRGGGDSTYSFNLASLLKKKGRQTCFFAMQDERNLPDRNSDLFVSHIDFRQLNRNWNLGLAFTVLMRSVYSAEAKVKFSRLLERERPDLVHLQNIHAHITPSVIFEAAKRSLPVVWTLHDYKLVCPNSHFLIDKTGEICEACNNGTYYQSVLKYCKKGSLSASLMAAIEAYGHSAMRVKDRVGLFLSPSVFLKNKLCNHGFSPPKVSHLPLFLPPEMFTNGARAEQKYMLFMGKLDLIKGILPLLDACRKVAHVKLVLAGPADHKMLAQLPVLLPDNATYVGMKHGGELRTLLLRARAVILPSLCYENQPFSITEAFAAGKPVIASDLGGMTELVKHGERGLLVPPGDVDALAAAMDWMVGNPGEAREMGERAREYAHREHSADVHYERLMHIYAQVMRKQ